MMRELGRTFILDRTYKLHGEEFNRIEVALKYYKGEYLVSIIPVRKKDGFESQIFFLNETQRFCISKGKRFSQKKFDSLAGNWSKEKMAREASSWFFGCYIDIDKNNYEEWEK